MSNRNADYGQDGVLSNINPGERVRNLMGGDGADVGQSGQGVLGGGKPGDRIRNLLGQEDGPDMGQGMEELEIPDNPGPAAAGRTPLVGTVRRSRGMPVVRDELAGSMGN